MLLLVAMVAGSVTLTMALSVVLLRICGCFDPRLLPPADAECDQSRKKNVLLVIAHPDDESMFFGPTLLSLAATRAYNVRVFCISSGNVEGKGLQRKDELVSACRVLKVPAAKVEVLDLPELQDGFKEHWDAQLLGRLVKRKIADYNIEILITFDAYGVSGHPNHRSVHHAIRALLPQLKSVVEIWQLESSCLLRKFLGPLDIYISLLEGCCCCCLEDPSKQHYFYSQDPWSNAKAMRQHRSQWLWYRKLFVIFSSYTYVNRLKRMVVK